MQKSYIISALVLSKINVEKLYLFNETCEMFHPKQRAKHDFVITGKIQTYRYTRFFYK